MTETREELVKTDGFNEFEIKNVSRISGRKMTEMDREILFNIAMAAVQRPRITGVLDVRRY